MSQLRKALLIIFAKYPEAGLVKTRLAKEIGPEPACEVYRLMLCAVLERTCPQPGDSYSRLVCFTPVARSRDMQALLEEDGQYSGPMEPQAEGDLGTRMWDACSRAFDNGAPCVILIGTDTPFINRERVLAAERLLRSFPVVIGEAEDGGYYLMGLATRKVAPLFRDIPWSTNEVYAATTSRIGELGLSVAALPVDYDIDDLADLRRLQRDLRKVPYQEHDGLSRLRLFLETSSWI